LPRPTAISAGLLLFRRTSGDVEVFLVHPGGPFWKNRDAGAWSIPKGLIDDGEEPLAAACRELTEETGLVATGPYIPLGLVSLGRAQQKAGKLIHAWACAGDADPATIKSNLIKIELPRGSGRWLEIPEIDRAAWFSPPIARHKINPAQAEFIDRLEAALGKFYRPDGGWRCFGQQKIAQSETKSVGVRIYDRVLVLYPSLTRRRHAPCSGSALLRANFAGRFACD